VSTPTELPACAQPCPSRRAALTFGAAAGAAALLTGCSTYGGSADADSGAAGNDAAADPGADASGGAEAGAGTAAVLAKTSDIPVGSGKIFAKKGVVVTQPTEGTFKAFSTVCTHQGCAVEKIADGTINCLCHGSKFTIADGSVAAGPAPKPLPARKIKVDGDSITLA